MHYCDARREPGISVDGRKGTQIHGKKIDGKKTEWNINENNKAKLRVLKRSSRLVCWYVGEPTTNAVSQNLGVVALCVFCAVHILSVRLGDPRVARIKVRTKGAHNSQTSANAQRPFWFIYQPALIKWSSRVVRTAAILCAVCSTITHN